MTLQQLKAQYDSLKTKKNLITESEQLEAVKQNGYALRYCHNPSEAVCLEAVKQNGDALRYCHNPSEAVCLEAVKQNGYALRFVPSTLFDSLPVELTVSQIAERLGITNLKIIK